MTDFVPAPSGLTPLTRIKPLPLGTITTADFAFDETTFAIFEPNLIVAFERPTPCSVTRVPARPWLGVIDKTSGHDRPAAIGTPNPDARS